MMLPVALLVGLDAVQSDACRSALGDRARVIGVIEAEDAVSLLALHRPKLIVMRTDLHLHQRRVIADLSAKIGARIASIGEKASAVNVEHLIEGFAAVTFARDDGEVRIESGTRRRVSPGAYHLAAPPVEAVASKKR
jgi:hypothetical protein